MEKRKLYLGGMVVLAASLFIRAGQNSSIPPVGNTNAPNESNCTSCHGGTLTQITNPFGGPLQLSITQNGLPFNPQNGYTPGATYDFSLTASVPGVTRYGFQATFIDPNTGQGVGSFTPGPGTTVQNGANNRTYVSHDNDTQAPTGSKTWTFRWTAPTGPNPPTAYLYLTMNAANGNNNTSGDQIYAFNAAVQPAAGQSTSIQCQLADNVPSFCPGGQITVSYQATGNFGPGNQFSLEISGPDGMFPGQIIGFGTGELSGQITGAIPPTLPGGSFRVRVNSSLPPFQGEPAPQVFTIAPVQSQIFGLPEVVCLFDSPVCLQAVPGGGQFQGPGMIDNCFRPDLAGEGFHLISYSGVFNGCNYLTTDTVRVVGTPNIDAVALGGGMGMPYELRAIGPPNLNYTWEPGGLQGQSVFVNPQQTTTYTVVAGVPGSNCLASDTVTVVVGGSGNNCDGFDAQILYDGPNPVCAGDTVTLRAAPFGSANVYRWTVNGMPYPSMGDMLSLTITETATIQLTVITPEGCMDTDELTLSVSGAGFQLTAEVVDASCPTCFDGTITVFPSDLAFYQINGMPANGNVMTGLSPGVYTITAGNGAGCTQTITVQVGGGGGTCTFPLLVSQVFPASCPTCPDGGVVLAPAGLIYNLNGVPYFSNEIFGLLPGEYYITATDSQGCVGEAYVTVPVEGGCNVDAQIFGLPSEMCVTDPVACMQAIPAGGVFNGPGIINEFCFSPAEAGVGLHYITYSGVTPDGCEFSTSIEVVVNECGGCNLEVYAYASPETLCIGQATTLIAEGSSFNLDYRWFDSNDMPVGVGPSVVVTPQFSGLYRVVATDLTQPNCEAEAYVYVAVNPLPQFTASGQNASCSTCPDGRIVVSPPTYTYFVNGMQMNVDNGAITGLTPGTYSVTAQDGFTLCFSAPVLVTVGFTPPPCPTPTGLNYFNVTSSSAVLSWNPVAQALSYRVRYRPASSNFWTTVSTAGTVLTLSGLTPATNYVAQVASNCGGFFSPNSALISFTTQPAGAACAQSASFNVTQTQSGQGTVLATWTAVTAATNYQIQYRRSGTVFWTTLNYNPSSSGTSALITGLQAGVSYQFRLRVICGMQRMPWQGPINLTLNRLADGSLGDDELQVAVFPNPNDGEFVLSLNAIEGKTHLRIYDLTGRTVYVGAVETHSGANRFTLNLRDVLSSGLYFLFAESAQGTAAVKFNVK